MHSLNTIYLADRTVFHFRDNLVRLHFKRGDNVCAVR